jgi:MYXO-CTERM domain-containing protein
MNFSTIAITALVLMRSAQGSTFTMSDQTFANASWSNSTIVDTTISGGSVNATKVLAGGNPGSYRLVELSGDGTGATNNLLAAHLKSLASWDPGTQGAIDSIAYSFDLSAPGLDLAKPIPAPFFSILLSQGSSYYLSTEYDVVSTTWAMHGISDLPAGDFWRINPDGSLTTSAHPDFSTSGGAIKFGFATAAGFRLPCDAPCYVGGIDNWSVTITSGESAPEPSSLGLAVGVLVAAMAWRRRRFDVKEV